MTDLEKLKAKRDAAFAAALDARDAYYAAYDAYAAAYDAYYTALAAQEKEQDA